MNTFTLGRVAALTLTIGLLGLAGCSRPAGDSPMSPSTGTDTPRTTAPMADPTASMPMPSASGPSQ